MGRSMRLNQVDSRPDSSLDCAHGPGRPCACSPSWSCSSPRAASADRSWRGGSASTAGPCAATSRCSRNSASPSSRNAAVSAAMRWSRASSCRRCVHQRRGAGALGRPAGRAQPRPRRRRAGGRRRAGQAPARDAAALKRRLRAIDETVALDLSRRNAAPEDNAALVTLSSAAQARQRVHLRYRSGEQQDTARDFDPYGLVWRGGRWYAVGHCHLRRDVRSFRLDRVIDVRALPASFGRPRGFRRPGAPGALGRNLAARARDRSAPAHRSRSRAARNRSTPSAYSRPRATPCGCRRRRTTSTGSRANSRACRSISACWRHRRCERR